jgi:ABC-type multidrug transport system permease subunit
MTGLPDLTATAAKKPMLPDALRATAVVVEKELRMLRRDWVGICLLILAPILVITVAGFSLAKVYGGDAGVHLLPLVDEDHGAAAKAITAALAARHEVELRAVGSRAEAQRMVRDRGEAAAALVIPAGTTIRLSAGGQPELLFYTDPVKHLEVLNFKLLISAVLERVSAAATDQARRDGLTAERRLEKQITDAANTSADLRASLLSLQRQASRRQARSEKLLETQLMLLEERLQADIDQQLARVSLQLTSADESQRERIAMLRDYFTKLAQARAQFGQWLMRLRALAGNHASEIPPPPEFPSLPPEIESFSSGTNAAGIDLGSIRAGLKGGLTLSTFQLPRLTLPPFSSLPEFSRIERLTKIGPLAVPAISLPGSLRFTERNLTGASAQVNIFDQEVPGFGVTFVLLGMLFGVALGLADEREWGTLDRLRASRSPIAATLVGKLLSRSLVGLAQLIILFCVGRLAFGIALGHTPAALLLPSAAIVFGAAAFGLMVAAVVPARDSVLPAGAIAIMTMAAVGGCWWPPELEPPFMQTLALSLPTTWAMNAYNDLMIRQLPATSAILPSAVITGFAMLYIAIAVGVQVRRFR